MTLVALAAPAGAQAASGVQIALGDSYTSGPLIPNQIPNPIGCGRSDHNYPSVVAGNLKPRVFTDISCGSAVTDNMTQPQKVPGNGTNPPQFNALRPDATLVTVGIGGNDAGLVGVAEQCAIMGFSHPTGHACRDRYAPGGKDQVRAKIDATKPKIAAVLQGIHDRSPTARVAIVGYPDVLPQSGNCFGPNVPLSPDDVDYLDGVIKALNSMIAGQAAGNDAEYVDTYYPSIGHDVCKLPPNRWFEGAMPTEPAYPLHPNAKGEASMGRSVLGVLSHPRPTPRLSALAVSPRHVRSAARASVSFDLSKAAGAVFRVRRLWPGRVVDGRCLRPTRHRAHLHSCRRVGKIQATISLTEPAGSSSFISRRLARRPGLYRLSARASIHGATGPFTKTNYRVLPRRR